MDKQKMRKIAVTFRNYLANVLKKTNQDEKGWACNTYGVEDGAFRFLVGKSEGKITLQRTRTLLK
jgi:hypothetical protein